jgi:hypothetical protein
LLCNALIAFIVFSMSNDFKPSLLWILLAHIWKKQCTKVINPDLHVLKRENHSAELSTVCNLYSYHWIRKAFMVVVCCKSSEPAFPEII